MFRYSVPAPEEWALRDAPYHRMRDEGLLPYTMSALHNPSLEDWRRLVSPERGWLVLCENTDTGDVCGVGMFTPWRGRVWEFDFTAFRDSFCHAVEMARGGFAWIFAHAPCDTIIGVCPAPNRHAWRLAEKCGFTTLGRLPGACYFARHDRCVDGVLVMLTRNAL